VCGTKNVLSLGARFYECTDDEGKSVLVTKFRTRFEHQSYPGRTHGGITSTLLDEAIGRSVSIPLPHAWGVTLDLNIKYKKPVPLDKDLYAITWTTKITSRVFEGEGYIVDRDGTVLATACGRYMQLDPSKISPEGITAENWFYVDEDLPTHIDIGGDF